jgi:predicted Fe-Mo cluster-binding NifX family protein
MKIAIAHWQGRVSPVFDVADHLLLLGIENGREVRRKNLRLEVKEPFARAQRLAEKDVDLVLCGAVSAALEKALTCAGIRVLGFLGGALEDIIAAYLNGKLHDGRTPPASRGERWPDLREHPDAGNASKPPVQTPGTRR